MNAAMTPASPIEPVNGCPQCEALWSDYHAATLEQLRIHNELDGARYARDRIAERNKTLEAYAITAKRESLRNSLVSHQKSVHSEQFASNIRGSVPSPSGPRLTA